MDVAIVTQSSEKTILKAEKGKTVVSFILYGAVDESRLAKESKLLGHRIEQLSER